MNQIDKAIMVALTQPFCCPECGGHDLDIEEGSHSFAYCVRCVTCGYKGPTKECPNDRPDDERIKHARHGAIVAWNFKRSFMAEK